MVISYFNYLWDIDGISAGSAIKGKELIAAMRRLGHTAHVEWRTPQPKAQPSASDRARETLKPALQKYLHEPKRVLVNAKHLWQEYHILQQQRPDVLFHRLELLNFSGLLLSRWLDVPMVIEADCPPSYEYLRFYGKEHKHLGDLPMRLELANLRGADGIIAISSILADYYRELGIPPEKIHVVPNGVDAQKFVPRAKDEEICARHGLDGQVVIGWVGSLYGWSGIENLIRMAKFMLHNKQNVSFLLVGGGKNKELFESQLQTNGYTSRVILPGTVPHQEVPRYLSCMDIVLAPYPKLDFWYPSSVKLFEYMASAKATVATRVGQISEVIDDGKNGLLFDPDDSEELQQKILSLVESEDKRRFLGEQARHDVLKKWTWEHQAQAIIEVFEEARQRRRARRRLK